MRFRSALANVRGLGSAKEGTHHFWMQRLTAIALIPLSVWFVASLVSVSSAGYAAASAWVSLPLVTVLLIALVVALFHHAQLGIQVVLEDYLHERWMKFTAVIAVKLAALLLGFACVIAVLRIALGSP